MGVVLFERAAVYGGGELVAVIWGGHCFCVGCIFERCNVVVAFGDEFWERYCARKDLPGKMDRALGLQCAWQTLGSTERYHTARQYTLSSRCVE
jgi:hypothetical protein